MSKNIYSLSMKFIEKMIESRLVPRDYREKFTNVMLSSKINNGNLTIGKSYVDIEKRIEKCVELYSTMSMTSKYVVLMVIRAMYSQEYDREVIHEYALESILRVFFMTGLSKINDERIINISRVMIAMDYLT